MAANYDRLATAILQRFAQLLGTAEAVRRARLVPSLRVSDDGTILSIVSRDDFNALVQNFKAVGGSISVYFMKNAIAAVGVERPSDLPEELR
jgi:hypothetical protein